MALTKVSPEILDLNNTAGTSNVRLGVNAGNSIESGGNYNVVVGDEAGTAITTGDFNTAVGYAAGAAVTTGVNNTLIGGLAGDAMTTASFNVALGTSALSAETQGNRNTAIGHAALAASNTTSNADTNNTAVGCLAGLNVTTGVQNTLIGAQAGDAVTTGLFNAFLGGYAGNTVSTGTGNTAIGYNSDCGTGAAVGRIAVGISVVCQSDQRITVGYGGNVASLELNGSDTSWAASSDERLKENVVSSTAGLSFINDLRPVTYNWKKAKDVPSNLPQYIDGSDDPCLGETYGTQIHGFIAQEVKTVLDNHPEVKDGQGVWQTDETTVQTLAPAALVPMLVKAIQEQSALITSLTARVAELEG